MNGQVGMYGPHSRVRTMIDEFENAARDLREMEIDQHPMTTRSRARKELKFAEPKVKTKKKKRGIVKEKEKGRNLNCLQRKAK